MRKSLLIIVTATALLASCANNDAFKAPVVDDSADQPLSFTAYADKVTKGSNSNALYDFYTVFAVYGWKTVNGAVATPAVFDNVPNEYFAEDKKGNVVYDGDDEKPSTEWGVPSPYVAAWYYENIRYWDKMATNYEFFAIAPYEASETPIYSVNPGDDNFTIATASEQYDISTEYNIALAGSPVAPRAALSYSGFKKDFMIAGKKSVKPTATNTSSNVQLEFHHILTKLNVRIKKSDDYSGRQILKVNELKIANLARYGNFVYQGMTTDGWNKADINTVGNTYDIDINTPYALDNGTTTDPEYPDNYWIEALIFPQTTNCKKAGAQATANGLSGIYLYIQYQIGNEKFNAYYDLAYVFDKTLAPEVPATYYTASDEEVIAGTKQEGEEKTPVVEGDVYVFEQGSQYNLTITVGPDPIYFNASVTKWATKDEGSLLID